MATGASRICYIRRSLLRALPPLIPGALTVEHRLDFARREPRWADDAHRFEEPWISLPDLAGFNAALELTLAVGIERIERRLRTRIQRLAAGLVERGARRAGPWAHDEDEGSGIVSFAGAQPATELLEALAAADVLAGQRGDLVRLSPHYYTRPTTTPAYARGAGPSAGHRIAACSARST